MYCLTQAKFGNSKKILRTDASAEPIVAQKQVRVIQQIGISSEIERAFVMEKDWLLKFGCAPKTLGYELYNHVSPVGENMVVARSKNRHTTSTGSSHKLKKGTV